MKRFVLADDNTPAGLRRVSAAEGVVRLGNWLRAQGGDVSSEVLDGLIAQLKAAELYAQEPLVAGVGSDPSLEKWIQTQLTVSLDAEQAAHLGSALSQSLDGIAVSEALWRRAEGSTLRWNLSESEPRTIRVAHHGVRSSSLGAVMEISEEGLRILSALTRWETLASISTRLAISEEAIAAWLVTFATHRLAFFADFDCGRTFPGVSVDLAKGDVRIALLDSVSVLPMLEREGGARVSPFMPRQGELEKTFGCGMIFETLRRGKVIASVEIVGGGDVFWGLRALLPCLDGTRNAEGCTAEIPDHLRDVCLRALRALATTGLLESVDVQAPLATPSTATAIWLGHASVMLSFDRTHVWIDPSLPVPHHQTTSDSSAAVSYRSLNKPSCVLITHGDNDHLCWPALARLATDTPIYFPSTVGAGPWQVDIPAVLKCMGFTSLHPMKPWETARIGEVEVTAAPFEGEDWGLELRTLTWLCEGPAKSVGGESRRARIYLSADAAGMLNHAPRLRAGGPIDLAFLGVSGAVDAHVSAPRFGYGGFYRRWLSNERWMHVIRFTNGPHEAKLLADALGARAVFGYAAGAPGDDLLSYCDEGSHAELEALLLGNSGPRAAPLEFGKPWSILVP